MSYKRRKVVRPSRPAFVTSTSPPSQRVSPPSPPVPPLPTPEATHRDSRGNCVMHMASALRGPWTAVSRVAVAAQQLAGRAVL